MFIFTGSNLASIYDHPLLFSTIVTTPKKTKNHKIITYFFAYLENSYCYIVLILLDEQIVASRT